MSRGAHPERQARRDRAVERRDPVLALLERPGDPDLRALVALAGDHERDPAGAVEDPHPLVDGPGQRDEPVHLEQVVVRQPDRGAELGSRCRAVGLRRHRHQKLIDLPSTAIAASPRTSDSVGWGCVAPPISHGVASSSNATDASAIRSVACGPMMWTPSVSSVSLFATTFAKPSYSPPMIALAIAWNGTLPILTGQSLLLGLLLGQPDRRDLGAAVRRPRLLDVVDLVDVLLAGDHVGGDDALVARRVREHQPADGVADRVQMRLARPHPAVDLDEALLDLGLRRLEADLLDVRSPAGRDEHHLGPDLLLVLALRPDDDADPVLRHLDLGRVEAGVGHDGHAAAGEAALERLADLPVLERDDRRQVFEDASPSSRGRGTSRRTRRRRRRRRRRRCPSAACRPSGPRRR